MGTHVLFLHAVQAFQRRLVPSYKKQLNWDDSGAADPVDSQPRADRKPLFTLLALITALVAGAVSINLYAGAPSGFEGFGYMLLGVVIGFLGAPVALILCFVAMVREKKYLWLNLVSIAICLATMLWLFTQS